MTAGLHVVQCLFGGTVAFLMGGEQSGSSSAQLKLVAKGLGMRSERVIRKLKEEDGLTCTSKKEISVPKLTDEVIPCPMGYMPIVILAKIFKYIYLSINVYYFLLTKNAKRFFMKDLLE